ncbi:Mediator of RNA polymerase II transcription subunit 23 [Talaromyces islandicus]|uniref:Mediator of RNA polymerase II transcription subunit 23 n=1 Tax=Talaromyces islandicus TaxID=28573 RepID=A0A0U1MBI3_TALIS|nr:Mediator of RNA polymerase II transcription subunit 23 [Talaromyces islandicus]
MGARVWFSDDAIERVVLAKIQHPKAFAISANVINNPPLGFIHYHMGAIHPYFPEIPGGFDVATLVKSADYKRDGDNDMVNGNNDSADLSERPSDQAIPSMNQRKTNISWRPSLYPNWSGPADFEWSLDYVPPPTYPNHRWLRVTDADDHNAINRTPVAQLVYEVWGPSYESWAIAAQQHYSLLENIENNQLHLYKFNLPWDMKGERVRMNFLAILGDDVLDTHPFNWPSDQGDEDKLILKLPHDLGRLNFVMETPEDSSEWAVELPGYCSRDSDLHSSTQKNRNSTQPLPITSDSASPHQHDQQYQHGMFDVHLPPATPTSSAVQNTSVYSNPEEGVASRQRRSFLEPSTPERCTAELTTREAFLRLLIVEKFDVCDPLCHFANEVPRRALDNPMVMYAILALASRHQAIMTKTTDQEVEQNTYHSRCLELLIPALSRPENTYNDQLLITIVLLRQHEELENRKDTRYHLVASIKLINMISKFSSCGGLAEAASWLFLRQAIYASLVQREPWKLQLENYERSQAFLFRDDSSYANVSVFQLARALRLVSRQSETRSLLERQEWEALEEDVSRWKINSPSSFRPLRYREPDAERGRPFSEVCMISGTTGKSY